MKLFLVRHGETDANRVLGHSVEGPMHNEPVIFKSGDDTNIPLNIVGRGQAEHAGGELPGVIDELYASPLLRVKETAEIIAGTKNIDPKNIQFRAELIEYHQGSLEGLTASEQKERMGVDSRGSGLLCNYNYTPWGGDNWETIYSRLSSFFDELKKHGHDKNIVCITSGGVIRMAYKIFLKDKSPSITKHIMIKNGSIHEFVID
ncbi:MAG: histidine phosphatase family protein [Minisyncoccia bacterium]